MAAVLSAPDVSRPLGLRDRGVLEVFYSCALRRAELIDLGIRDVDYDRGTVFVRCGKGAKDRYVPIGERALFWLRLYVELARPGFVTDRCPEHLFLSSVGTPLCPDWLSRKVRKYLALAGVDKRGAAICFATPSPRSCSRAEPTSGMSPKCSATPGSRRPSATPG
jgi:integrase/recombinase XerD